ncbi:helix-turn-helix transcriptional regulator [bacterium]|nr:helix-turn-helix transcriptional regulator [bacterium]
MQQQDIENLHKLGKKIKELRLEKSKSLNEFVLNKGYLTTATWSRIENGLFDIKFSTLLRIARMLDIRADELLKSINLDYNFTDD